MREATCASDCKGILIEGDVYTGTWSGCACKGATCDCPQHPTIAQPGKCRQPMWSGYGLPAGNCAADAYGPGTNRHGLHLAMACPRHGGPAAAVAREGGGRR